MKLNNNPKSISSREAYEKLKKDAVLVDIRPEYDVSYRLFDVERVFLIPYNEVEEKYNVIPKDKELVIADCVGMKSPEIAKFFANKGFSKVWYLSNGIIGWDHDGLPLVKDSDYEMHGQCACMIKPKKNK